MIYRKNGPSVVLLSIPTAKGDIVDDAGTLILIQEKNMK